MSMITQFRGTKRVTWKLCMIAIFQRCGWAAVETPTTWRRLL